MNLIARIGRIFRREASTRWPVWAINPAPARQALAARARDAQRGAFLATTPIGATIVQAFTTSAVADGPSVRPGHPDQGVADALSAMWSRFYASCDAEGLGDLGLYLGRAMAGLVVNGETFSHMQTSPRGELRLRLLNPEQIDPSMTMPLPDGGEIIAGIEFNALGERVAYHIREGAPDSPSMLNMMLPPRRVAAADVAHCFEPKMAGAIRGTSWLAPVAQPILETYKIQDSLAARMATAALFGGFVTNADGSSAAFDDAGKSNGNAELSLEPGVLRFLPPGTSIEFPTLPGTEGADALIKHMIRAISSGVGMPPFLLTGDYGEINYSAGKLGLENFKRRIAAIRANLLGAMILQPIWRRLVTLEILSGRLYAPSFIADPAPYFAMTAVWPGFASIEPLKEAQADVLMMRARLRSRAEIVEQRGRDIADLDAEIDADPNAADLSALTFQENANAA